MPPYTNQRVSKKNGRKPLRVVKFSDSLPPRDPTRVFQQHFPRNDGGAKIM